MAKFQSIAGDIRILSGESPAAASSIEKPRGIIPAGSNISKVAEERLTFVSTLYKSEDSERDALRKQLEAIGITQPDPMQLPMERAYFNGAMLEKYEPCIDALQAVLDADGEDDDAWHSFEQMFGKFMDFSWASNWDGKRYDIVIYGCSGYTGYLSMEYLKRVALKRTPEKFTFAFAGRTASKVAAMRDKEFKGTEWEDTPILQASYDDPVSMIDLARSARCVFNVAGPYMLTPGEILVDACCFAGTHYVDINGEIPWMSRVNDLHERAIECKSLIVPAAAVAGGNSDLLVSLLAKQARENYGEELKSASCYWAIEGSNAVAGGGTLATRDALATAGDAVTKLMADPFALGGFIPERDRNGLKEVSIRQGTGETSFKLRRKDQDSTLAKITQDKVNNCWLAPHVYAFFDTRIVRRTNALLADFLNQPYGREFNFTEFAYVSPDADEKAISEKMKKLGGAGVEAEKEELKAAGKYYGQGEGPPLESMDDAYIYWLCWAESTGGHIYRNAFHGRDGYFESARVAIETALSLVFDYDELPIKGGCVTCASVGSRHVSKRLINSGLGFRPTSWYEPHEFAPPPPP